MATLYVNLITDWSIPQQLKFIEVKIYGESGGRIGPIESHDVLIREIYQDISQITINNSRRAGLAGCKELRISFENLPYGRYRVNFKLFSENFSQFQYNTQLITINNHSTSIDFTFYNTLTETLVDFAVRGGLLGDRR